MRLARIFSAATAALVAAVGSGFLLLGAYHATPGDAGSRPARWPAGARVPFSGFEPGDGEESAR